MSNGSNQGRSAYIRTNAVVSGCEKRYRGRQMGSGKKNATNVPDKEAKDKGSHYEKHYAPGLAKAWVVVWQRAV